jgi:hypothetical protein
MVLQEVQEDERRYCVSPVSVLMHPLALQRSGHSLIWRPVRQSTTRLNPTK